MAEETKSEPVDFWEALKGFFILAWLGVLGWWFFGPESDDGPKPPDFVVSAKHALSAAYGYGIYGGSRCYALQQDGAWLLWCGFVADGSATGGVYRVEMSGEAPFYALYANNGKAQQHGDGSNGFVAPRDPFGDPNWIQIAHAHAVEAWTR